MKTAREAFLASPDRAEFEKMATTLPFEAACRAALLVYIEEQHIVEFDPNQACAGHHRIMGARKVLDMLREIHLKIEPPKPDRPRQLRPPS
jgi:hypothetical protein